MIKTFTCYHHRLDQEHKELFVNWATASGLEHGPFNLQHIRQP